MVIGYGELDISFGILAGTAIYHRMPVLEALHSIRTEKGRIDISEALSRGPVTQMGLGDKYDYVVNALRYCLKLRNKFAHSHWGDIDGVLCYSSAENAFTGPKTIKWFPLTLELLQSQEAYFEHTRLCILILTTAIEHVLVEKEADLPWPEKMKQPSMHSPPQKQAPPRK